ncbi:MAG: hypothetical protein MJB12_10495 [Firmicutes bacterium]|nr:hypothetical protein [Bacillota bacterium]
MNNVEEYYNCQYDEWGRLERHRLEYEMTKKVLNEYIEENSEVQLKTIRIIAAEGLGAMCENTLMQLSEEDFMAWVDLLYQISDRKVIWGSCEHLLYVGKNVG